MTDLVVDYDRLAQLGQQLANLRGEFKAGHDAIGPMLGTVSDSELRSRLKGFTDNWSDERAKLSGRLEKASLFAVRAAACYLKADVTLAGGWSGRR